jgi:hypothetical protein
MSDIETGYDEETTTCDYCGARDAERFGFGRLGRLAGGGWGVVELYTEVLCADCARLSGKAVR